MPQDGQPPSKSQRGWGPRAGVVLAHHPPPPPSDHAGRKLTRYDVVDAMDRRLRDGQLTVKRSHRVSGNRRKDASDLDIYLEGVTGIEPALSAWE
jgi:hypothetical protein